MNGHIIRRGNHFLRLECGWVLIDGPWFDYLNGFGRQYVNVASLEPFSMNVHEINDLPSQAICTYLVWEQVRWHPGTLIPKSMWWKWNIHNYLVKRVKFGWRIRPDGNLPAYLNRVEFAKDLQHDEELRLLENAVC